MEAGAAERSPLILQVSAGARKYAGQAYIIKLVEAALATVDLPVVLHLDHGQNFEICKEVIDGGFSSVMIDGSHLPYEENIALTRKVVEYAHDRGVWVEAELGRLAGVEDDVHAAESVYTDPDQAAEFVGRTGCDSLAIAIGTSHGAYKFSRPPTGEVLVMSLIEEIHRRIPNTHLVMHGSSSIPQELLEIIRKYGGKIKETYGVPIEEIKRGIQHGVRKINVDTDKRLAMTGAIRRVFAEFPEKFDPREYLGEARAAMKKVCMERMVAFGQAGNAPKIKPVTLKQMAIFYRTGEIPT
jgi:fructose-bisphosphate aldolase class II